MNKFPKLYDKDYNSLINDFLNLSSEYTPEWNMNLDNNDFGLSFARIFCTMQEDTIDRLNKSIKNIYITLLNFIGVSPTPCVPSRTFAFISASKNSGVHNIKKGTKLISSNENSNIVFETLEDTFVIDNEIQSIFMSDVNNSKIVNPYNIFLPFEKFKIFDFDHLKDLQKKYIYIYDNNIFNAKESSIEFQFKNDFSKKDANELFDSFLKSDWEYFNGKNWEKSSFVKGDNNLIEVKIDKKIEKFNILNEDLRCLRIAPNCKSDFDVTEITYLPSPILLKPDDILYGEELLDELPLYPFKEKFNLYDTFIIKSDEAFSKSGASIVISADFDFIMVDSEFKNYIKNYKLIMSDIDFTESEPLNICIENVVWEYWAKNSWIPIKGTNKGSGKFFYKGEQSQRHTLEFICPDDISETSISSVSGLFIRARISKITNQYSNYFNYISPFLKKIDIKYSYDSPRVCNEIIVDSDLECKKINLINNEKKIISIFKFNKNKDKSIYLNMSNPISEGILNIFFDIEDGVYDNDIVFKWEYWGSNPNGSCSWKILRIIDYTNGLLKSGTVRIIFSDDFHKTKIFNQTGYFIRISMINSSKDIKHFPCINGIYLNGVRIIQKESMPFEYFFIKDHEENKVCSLLSKNKNIFDLEVWVNEKDEISSSECEKFQINTPDNIEIQKDNNGNINKIWIKWEETNNILNSDFTSRVYEFDHQTSKVRFGDGTHGKIPSEKYGKNIRIKYSLSNGESGNVDECTIESFSSRIPYVSNVYNPRKSLGGLDFERIEHASERTLSKISNGNRIVSKKGFEQGILFNDRRIYKVKCFSHIDQNENNNVGSLTVVVLPKNYKYENEILSDIKESILMFLKNNAPFHITNSKKLYVREATYVKFLFKVTARIDDFRKYQDIHDKIVFNIKQFIDPIHGGNNKNGFEIGHLPSYQDMLNNIRFIDGSYITEFEVYTKVPTQDGEKEMLLSDAKNIKFAVPTFDSIDLNIRF